MPGVAGSSGGPWRRTCGPTSSWPRWTWRSQRHPGTSSTTPTRAASTRPSPSGRCARWACSRRWARSATPTTTRCARASSPPSSASSSTALDSRTRGGAAAVFEFIEGWYNPHRRHSALAYDSPIRYEQRHQQALATPGPRKMRAVFAPGSLDRQGGRYVGTPQTAGVRPATGAPAGREHAAKTLAVHRPPNRGNSSCPRGPAGAHPWPTSAPARGQPGDRGPVCPNQSTPCGLIIFRFGVNPDLKFLVEKTEIGLNQRGFPANQKGGRAHVIP